jgi:hypothetical protein
VKLTLAAVCALALAFLVGCGKAKDLISDHRTTAQTCVINGETYAAMMVSYRKNDDLIMGPLVIYPETIEEKPTVKMVEEKFTILAADKEVVSYFGRKMVVFSKDGSLIESDSPYEESDFNREKITDLVVHATGGNSK